MTEYIAKIPNTLGIIISYPLRFELRDRESDLRVIEQAKCLKVKSSMYQKELDKMVAQITLEDDTYLEKIKEVTEAEYDVESEVDVSGKDGEAT